ncbi:phosphoserine phosphatase 1 [Clostridium tepidiprofundi DSM 19306]|uniref:Alpha-ribazole phosphatase n=1 Tax=Clostridium tepidiprofundi DSM 19306 TaxID=1121338 RepID=A0A151B648_9CLOT|nr:phosphoserine phosphatase 1 [Clostridium tepidiprofundi DSM 19306]
MKSLNIYLLRHGQTNENKEKLYYGDMDIDMNECGKKQIYMAAKHLKNIKFDKVFISERKRTRQTADIIFKCKRNDYIIDPRLNESSFGIFEGLTYEEIINKYPEEYKKWSEDWVNYCPLNGESCSDMCNRVNSFMDDLKNIDAENILIITHSGVMRAIYCYLLDKNINMFWKFGCKNGDIALLKYEYGNMFLDSILHCNS